MTIQFDNVSFQYRSPFSPVRTALSDVSFRIKRGEIVAVVGATGSGKTTLIQHLNGLLQPTRGRVVVDSVDLLDSCADLSKIRRRVGLVFQFPETQLFEETVYEDVAFGPRNLNLPETKVEEKVCRALLQVGLDFDKFRNLLPFHLSGGEKRRVAIAGVLAIEPEVLVLDEPTVSLDKRAAFQVEEIIRKYHFQGKTVIFVSHDMDLVARLALRVLVLYKGRVQFDGSRKELFQDRLLLERVGLDLPRVCRFLMELVKKGYPVRTDIFTVEEAKKELERVFGKRGRK